MDQGYRGRVSTDSAIPHSTHSKMSLEHIYPEANGPAAQIVKEHKDPQEIVLYAGWVRDSRCGRPMHMLIGTYQFCPFTQRTWIALEEKGIPYQYKEVNPYKKEDHFLGTFIHSSSNS